MDWTDIPKLPTGKWAKAVVDWLKDHAGAVFDAVKTTLEATIEGIAWLLQTPPAWSVVIAFGALTYLLQRRIGPVVVVVLGLLYVLNQRYWDLTTESLALVITACIFCIVVGVPLGILSAHNPRFYRVLQPVLDTMQTLPTLVYMIPAVVFFGIGVVPGLMFTVIFVLPVPIRMTHLGIISTPLALLEAADAFGATKWQKLFKVELPSAFSQIMVGLNQTIMLSLSMVVLAAYVGAAGLGVPVVRAVNSVNTALGFEAGFVIVAIAFVLDRMLRK
jgi:glycine betaine/proline transport system permease protein